MSWSLFIICCWNLKFHSFTLIINTAIIWYANISNIFGYSLKKKTLTIFINTSFVINLFVVVSKKLFIYMCICVYVLIYSIIDKLSIICAKICRFVVSTKCCQVLSRPPSFIAAVIATCHTFHWTRPIYSNLYYFVPTWLS